MSTCLFCLIVHRERPAHIIMENEHALVIKDLYPKADIHWLVIPRTHYNDLRSYHEDDTASLGNLMQTARTALRDYGNNQAFKLLINNGAEAGQHIFHIHLHLLAGKIDDAKHL
jgi:histidine triad (HIT) family protein